MIQVCSADAVNNLLNNVRGRGVICWIRSRLGNELLLISLKTLPFLEEVFWRLRNALEWFPALLKIAPQSSPQDPNK